MHIPRIVRKLLVSMFAVGLLLVMAGAAYALYGDRTAPVLQPSLNADASAAIPPIKHVAPSPNAPASAAVEAISSPVQAGDAASISVQTLEGATCTIDIGYSGAPSNMSFRQQTAGDYGVVSWNWPVALAAPVGSWPVTITCVYHSRSAVVSTNLEIDKK